MLLTLMISGSALAIATERVLLSVHVSSAKWAALKLVKLLHILLYSIYIEYT